MSRKAQITVFIIVGIVVLFMFFFLMMLASSMQKTKLADTQERIVTSLISKEAFRLYVEDCLSDALEEGLILLGQQGRIWSDQPGGRISFDEQRTGIIWSGNRTAYGITFDTFSEPNSYPCNKASSAPEFCQYTYPDTSLGFGQLEFKPQTLENDLKLYLAAQTVSCVENFTKTNISSSAKLTSTEMKLVLDLREEGINVQVEYPLSFTLGKEDFFYLSEFDFFYATNFKQLLDAAVVYPLQFDSRYLDFNYNEETLNQAQFIYNTPPSGENCQPIPGKTYSACSRNSFADDFANLQIQTNTFPLANGDDIFVFTAPNIIHNQESYEFRIARQNRPPALDYVNRMACPAAGYDYLVIPNDEELGDINISLFALDPDEDAVSYSFDYSYLARPVPRSASPGSASSYLPVSISSSSVFVDKQHLAAYPSKFYNLTVRSSDGNLEDNQTIRILVDQPLDLAVSLTLPYKIPLPSDTTFPAGTVLPYSTLIADGTIIPAGPLSASTVLPRGTLVSYADFLKVSRRYFVTIEDPVFINVSLPKTSLDTTLPPPEITLKYTSPNENFEYSISTLIDSTSRSGCFSLPWLKGCSIDAYNFDVNKQHLIAGWPASLLYPRPVQSSSLSGDFSHFKELTNNLPGKLNLSINLNYCNYNNKSDSESVEIIVKQCIPHQNPEHPYAYPYHKYTFGLDANGKTDLTAVKLPTDINPFLAAHSCCNPNSWTVYGTEKECFISPDLKCYPSLPFNYRYTDTILAEWSVTCDGSRGNVCNGNPAYDLPKIGSEPQLICGNVTGCVNVATHCKGKKAWGYVDTDNNHQLDGWCNGAMGCQTFCNKEVAAIGAASPQSFNINALALGKVLAEDVTIDNEHIDVGFTCGCQQADQYCDSNYDSFFNGICRCRSDYECGISDLYCDEAG